jgi:hypothetical protein
VPCDFSDVVGVARERCEREVGDAKNNLGREKEMETCGETCDACRKHTILPKTESLTIYFR